MKGESVRSVERAFNILKCFSLDENRLYLLAISDAMGLPTSTTMRLVSTLVALGLLKRNSDRSYSIGSEGYLIGVAAQAGFRPEQIAYPYMADLQRETNETVTLYGMESGSRICFERIPGAQELRHVVRIGDRFPLWAGAAGRVMLAYEGEDVINREAEKAHRITEATIVPRERLIASLAEVRMRDYAQSSGEREDGVASLAVPIFNKEKRAPYSISVSAPASRFDDEVVSSLIPKLQEISGRVSRQFFAP